MTTKRTGVEEGSVSTAGDATVSAEPGITPDAGSDAAAPTVRRRRWPWLLGGVGAVAIIALLIAASGGNAADPVTAASPNTSEVVQTDLVEVQTYDATLGTVAGDPITSQRSGTITASVAAGETAEAGDVLYEVDGEPVVLMYGEAPAWRDLGPTEDNVTLVNRVNGTVTAVVATGAILENGDVAYRINGEPITLLHGDLPAYRALYDASTNLEGDDVLQLEQYLDAAGYNDVGMAVDGEFTSATESVVENWQDDIGATVDGRVELGEIIFVAGNAEVVSVAVEVGDIVADGVPVITLTGDEPMQGADVGQLEENLASLGHDADGDLVVDGVFDDATSRAVASWEAEIGVDVDGIVSLGDIVFVSTAIRVSEQLAPPGTVVTPGAAVLSVSSADKVVTLDLPAEDQDIVEVGTAVTVELPDGTDVAATVTDVATVASVDQQGNAVFEVTIELDDPATASGLDEAPVDVEAITDSVEDVMAVPVTALVALAEGGYAVEVEADDGGLRLVAVDPGFFADGLVEVTSDGLEPGDRVVVP